MFAIIRVLWYNREQFEGGFMNNFEEHAKGFYSKLQDYFGDKFNGKIAAKGDAIIINVVVDSDDVCITWNKSSTIKISTICSQEAKVIGEIVDNLKEYIGDDNICNCLGRSGSIDLSGNVAIIIFMSYNKINSLCKAR